jgi:hypothetical protein
MSATVFQNMQWHFFGMRSSRIATHFEPYHSRTQDMPNKLYNAILMRAQCVDVIWGMRLELYRAALYCV